MQPVPVNVPVSHLQPRKVVVLFVQIDKIWQVDVRALSL